ncbi:MAG: FecR domain-containing protein [Steroidobacteraceae bacterium]
MAPGTPNDEVRKEAARWAEQLMDRDLSAAEREAFQEWLLTAQKHRQEFRAHMTILNLARELPHETSDELLTPAEGAFQRQRRRQGWITGLAASVLLTLGLAGWFVYQNKAPSPDHVTLAGMTRDVTLPDGSVAHLNTRTDLRWIGSSDERRVALLEGEALFDVRHDAAKPFTVILDASEIRVLGTRFNVRRRQNGEVVVTVLEGTVAVAQLGSTQPAWKRKLHANEQIVYGTTGLLRDVRPAAGANAARWREGILEFEDESLSTIVADLGRYTDRRILVRDPRLAQLRLGGQLNVRDNIQDSLGLLEKLAPVAAHQSDGTFVLDYRQGPDKEGQ